MAKKKAKKLGRPPERNGVARLETLTIRLSHEELKALERNADRADLPRSAYAVQMLRKAGALRFRRQG